MARTLTVVAVVLIVLGAVAIAGPTFGFSTIASDRGVNVDTANNPSALVGLAEIHENEINNQNKEEAVVEISNNLNDTMELQTEIHSLTNLEIADGFDGTLTTNDSTALVLQCGSGGGTENFTVEVTEAQVKEQGVQVEDASIEASVDYDCPGQSIGSLTVSNQSTGDTDAELEFTLENPESNDVEIDAISLDDTTTSATVVDNGNDPEIRIGDQEINHNNNPSEVPIDGSSENIRPRPTVNPDDKITVEIVEFQDDNGDSVSISGETISITLYYKVSGGNASESFEIDVSDS